MVQPACSGPADARLTKVSAVARSPAAVRAAAGTPSDRHDETKSEAIARSRSRTDFDSGHLIFTGVAGLGCSAVGRDSRFKTVGFRAVDALCTEDLAESQDGEKRRV